jgi:putative ABC transport system permease protein
VRPLAHSLRSFAREWRSGELATLLAAVTLSVGAMSAVALFTDRVRTAMSLQAGEALAADLVIESRDRLPPELEAQAAARGLATARVVTFPSVIATDRADQLVEVRAVTAGYPLRGSLRVADRPYARGAPLRALPARGELWAEPRLFAALGLAPGDRVRLGASEFTLARVLDYLPDQGWSFVDVAPTVLMAEADLAGTGLLGPASRANHRLLVAGAGSSELRAEVEPTLARGQRLLDVRDGRPELRAAIDRAGRFLGLAALVAVLLAAVAVAMAARRWARREADAAAILKCLGARQRQVLAAYALVVLWVALVAGLAGALLGWAAQAGLVALLGDLLPADLPAPSLAALPTTVGLGAVVLAGFALPPVWALGGTPPLRVLRRDLEPRWGARLASAAALGAVVALLWWQARDARIATLVLGGLGAVVGAFALAAWLALRALGRIRGRVGVAWRYGVANVVRRGRESIAQLIAFGIGIAVLLLLGAVRTDLLEQWRATLPADAPNRFLINVQPDEVAPLTAYLGELGVVGARLEPLVRARLVEVDGRPIGELVLPDPRARNFVERESNLTWRERPQDGNRVVDGRWWEGTPAEPEASFEVEIARVLGFGIGTMLTYEVAGERVTARVTSLREVDWDSFKPNFFVALAPGALEGLPATYVGSVHLPPERAAALLELTRRFPSVTVIDTDVILQQVRDVIARASLTVEFVFLFTLGAGLLVLLAAVEASRDERRFESAVLRTLGAARRVVLAGVAAEFLALGLLAGLLAVLAAGGVEWLLAREVFDMPWRPAPALALIGAALGTLLVGATGVLATYGVVGHPPAETLRKG